MKFILGRKIQMSQIFKESGDVVPVTIVEAGPCFVVQVREIALGGKAIQVGFEKVKEKKLAKPQLGHLKNLPCLKILREFRDKDCLQLKKGDEFNAGIFAAEERVEVTGFSKGKGFQGVVKRHGFAGGPASHGHKDNLRMPGAIGVGGVQRVFKDMRMAGRMGGGQITVKNLEIVEVDIKNNLLKIKGALPGGRGSLLEIKAPGEIKVLQATKIETGEDNKTVTEKN
ncbi:MAG: 50S ribosomal protein L3 [Candidatus Magasanikbacteria bacterium]|nr:50S ribosomal protein L3 [Candidatus Magasanikbacteria bacterium]